MVGAHSPGGQAGAQSRSIARRGRCHGAAGQGGAQAGREGERKADRPIPDVSAIQKAKAGSVRRMVGRRFRRAGDRGVCTVISVGDDGYYTMEQANGRRFKVPIAGLTREWIEEDEPSNELQE